MTHRHGQWGGNNCESGWNGAGESNREKAGQL